MEINLGIRTKIIEFSLRSERLINNIITVFLLIDKTKTKAFGNKSTSFSFKQKIDLLYDVSIITKIEHLKLELLMIVRNQFMHNADCNSYVECINILDTGLKKRLLKEYKYDDNLSEETNYSQAYELLYSQSILFLIDKYDKRREAIIGRFDKMTDLRKVHQEVVNFTIESFKEIFDCMKYNDDFQPYEALKKTIKCVTAKYKDFVEIIKYDKFTDNLQMIVEEDLLNSLINTRKDK